MHRAHTEMLGVLQPPAHGVRQWHRVAWWRIALAAHAGTTSSSSPSPTSRITMALPSPRITARGCVDMILLLKDPEGFSQPLRSNGLLAITEGGYHHITFEVKGLNRWIGDLYKLGGGGARTLKFGGVRPRQRARTLQVVRAVWDPLGTVGYSVGGVQLEGTATIRRNRMESACVGSRGDRWGIRVPGGGKRKRLARSVGPTRTVGRSLAAVRCRRGGSEGVWCS